MVPARARVTAVVPSEESDSVHRGEQIGIAPAPATAPLQHRGEPLQLGAPDGCQQVGHPVVVADIDVLVVDDRLPSLRREIAGARGHVRVIAQECAATEVVMILLPLKDTIAAMPSWPGCSAIAAGAQRLGGVHEDRHVVSVADAPDGVVVGHLADQVDGHDRGDVSTRATLILCCLGQQQGINVAGLVGVDEDRSRAGVGDGVGRRRERHRRRQHDRVGAGAELEQTQVQRGTARGESHGVGATGEGGELGLEGVDLGAQWRDPTGTDRANKGLLLTGCDVGEER